MRMIYLHTVYLVLCVLVVRSEGSDKLREEERGKGFKELALEQIRASKKLLTDEKLNLLGVGSQSNKQEIGKQFKSAMNKKLNEMANDVKDLSDDSSTATIAAVGDAATETATFIAKIINGGFTDDEGNSKANDFAVAAVNLAQKFADIGGTFAPPPFGQAITTGFGIVNTIMALAGITPKVPTQRDMMKQLIDEQTEIVLKEFEKLHQKFWDDIMSETQAVLDMIERPTRYLNEYINMKPRYFRKQEAILDTMKDKLNNVEIKIHEQLSKIKTLMDPSCIVMKTVQDENKCMILLESYSEMYNAFADVHRQAMEVFNKIEKKNITTCGRSGRRRSGNHLKGLVCQYKLQIQVEIDIMKDEVFKPFVFGLTYSEKNKTSKTCIKTRLLSPGKFPFTNYALRQTGLKLGPLTESEESSKDIVCPSSNTKLMLVGGDKDSSVQLLSPEKKCGKFKSLPYPPNYRPAAAFYTTTSGEERVMVCGGENGYTATMICTSIGSNTSANWQAEPSLKTESDGYSKLSLAFDKYNFHAFGGFTTDELKKNKLTISYGWFSDIPQITKGQTPFRTRAREQILSSKELRKYTVGWREKIPGPVHSNTSYMDAYENFIGARCTVFHDGQFYSQSLDWERSEIPGPAQFTKKANYNVTEEEYTVGDQYTNPIRGCLTGFSLKTIPGVSSVEDCQRKCSDRFGILKRYCKSLLYNPDTNTCILYSVSITQKEEKRQWKSPCEGKQQSWSKAVYSQRMHAKWYGKIDRDPAYTPGIKGCLWKHNNVKFKHVESLQDCQSKCTILAWCKSMDYWTTHQHCFLSTATKDSEPNDWKADCNGHDGYLYSEKFSAPVDLDKTAFTIGRWKDLPSEKYPYSRGIHSCAVGVIFGQTSFVTSGPQGVYYFPIPYDPEKNPEHISYEWKFLKKAPEDCKAGLGWADGKLVCVPITKNASKKFYYFEEHEGISGVWKTNPKAYFSRPTYGLSAYVTVPGSFDNGCKNTRYTT